MDEVMGRFTCRLRGMRWAVGRYLLTPSSSSLSSRWRGMMVTISISHRKATSGGVRPDGSGSAMIKYQLEN